MSSTENFNELNKGLKSQNNRNNENITSSLKICLSGEVKDEMLYKELKTLIENNDYNKIKEYIHENEELRTSMHEAAHVIVGNSFGLNFDSVTIGEQDNVQDFTAQEKIGGKSSGQTRWKSFFQFTDQSLIQMSLAGYVSECALGIDYKEANNHAQQDFYDILNWMGFGYIYEQGLRPKGFNDKGDIVCEKCEPVLSSSEVRKELINIAYKECKNVGSIILNNRRNLYLLGIELYGKKKLDKEQVDSILYME